MVWTKPSLWADRNGTNDIGTNRSVVGPHRKKSTPEPSPRANLKRPTYHKDSKVLGNALCALLKRGPPLPNSRSTSKAQP